MCGTREERFTVKGFTAGILAALVSDSSPKQALRRRSVLMLDFS
jgi:hypothetical protein